MLNHTEYHAHENDGMEVFKKHMALRQTPTTAPGESYLGKSWYDMPGITTDAKHLNFTLFRWGLLNLEENSKKEFAE